MVARKSLLRRFDSYRAMLAWASSSTLRSRSVFTLRQLVLHADQVAQHAVEGVAEVLELVAGLDLAADVQLAGGDGVADLLEVLDRLDDDVADDEVAAGHDEQRGDEGGGDEQGAVKRQWMPVESRKLTRVRSTTSSEGQSSASSSSTSASIPAVARSISPESATTFAPPCVSTDHCRISAGGGCGSSLSVLSMQKVLLLLPNLVKSSSIVRH